MTKVLLMSDRRRFSFDIESEEATLVLGHTTRADTGSRRHRIIIHVRQRDAPRELLVRRRRLHGNADTHPGDCRPHRGYLVFNNLHSVHDTKSPPAAHQQRRV